MAKFDRNINADYHRFDNPNTNKYDFHNDFKFNIKEAMSDAIPIWQLEGLTKEQYYNKYPIIPLWKLLKFNNEEEWLESQKPKVNNPIVNNDESANDDFVEHVNDESIECIKDLTINEKPKDVEHPVKETITKIEKKIKKLNLHDGTNL